MDRSVNTLNDNQREILITILAKAFQEIRRLAWEGKSKQAGDLADAFHNIPSVLSGEIYRPMDFLKSELKHYQSTYHTEHYPGKFDYIQFLTENWETLEDS